MGPSKEGTRILHFERTFTNMPKYMCSGNSPKLNTGSGLTPNGGGPAGDRPGSAPAGRAAELARVSRPALRGLFAPGTPASTAAVPGGSGGPAADVAGLAAPPGRPSCAVGVVAVELAAGVETEASSRPGTAAAGLDVEPDAQPARRGHRRVGRLVDVLADVACANPSSPPPDGMAATWR